MHIHRYVVTSRYIRSNFSVRHLSCCLLLLDTYVKGKNRRVKTMFSGWTNYLFSIRFHGVMVNIPDFLSGAPSSSLGETYFL